MTGWLIRLVLAAAIFFVCALAAAEPPPAETLPQPREFQITPLPPEAYGYPSEMPVFLPYQRTSAYAHWQMVGVNRQGFFRPLVVYTPEVPYYRYNGKPYLFAPMHQPDFMPYIAGTPYR
jgi:hypothetical protein